MSETKRRLAAILFSDLVGYTAQMGADEGRAIRAVERSRDLQKPLVERFRGEWLQEIGDGALAIFPSSVDAVACALAIQQAALRERDVLIRIGIHEGDIVVQGSDVFGDGVNVAARLQQLARPGGICASDRVYEDVRNQRDVRGVFLGEKLLKNVSRPIRVWALADASVAAPEPLEPAGGWLHSRRARLLALAAVLLLVVGASLVVRHGETMLAKLILNVPILLGPRPDQTIGFATAPDGVRIAYATTGSGFPVVNVTGWFTHLERGLNSPAFSLAPSWEDHILYVRYDGRGTGLSDRDVRDYSLAAKLADLGAVVDALGLERFAVYGQSAGGATALAYAALHPERIARLVTYGAFARVADTPERERLLRSLVPVIRTGWGQDTPAFRQIFTSLFMPGADELNIRLFNEFQRLAATPEDAARFLDALIDVDVRDLATRIRAPTLVIHQRGDALVPYALGRELATLIPNARLLTLEGSDHALSPSSPEGRRMLKAVDEFLLEGIREAARR